MPHNVNIISSIIYHLLGVVVVIVVIVSPSSRVSPFYGDYVTFSLTFGVRLEMYILEEIWRYKMTESFTIFVQELIYKLTIQIQDTILSNP